MNKERELLERAPVGYYLESVVDQNQDGWFYPYFILNRGVKVTPKKGAKLSPVYLRPEQKHIPLSGKEVYMAIPDGSMDFKTGFFEGARWAEKHHGIGGEDE